MKVKNHTTLTWQFDSSIEILQLLDHNICYEALYNVHAERFKRIFSSQTTQTNLRCDLYALIYRRTTTYHTRLKSKVWSCLTKRWFLCKIMRDSSLSSLVYTHPSSQCLARCHTFHISLLAPCLLHGQTTFNRLHTRWIVLVHRLHTTQIHDT